MKKLVCFLLAAVMVLTMTTSVFAATVTNGTGHSYDAYQIFKGTQADDDMTLGDVAWGAGIKGDEFLAALKADTRFGEGDANIFNECTDAMAVAKVLGTYGDKSAQARDFADVADQYLTDEKTAIAKDAAEVTLEAGYYLLVDTETIADDANDARNSALLQVTNKGSVEMQKKYSLPVPGKYISEVTREYGGEKTTVFTDSAAAVDAAIGDEIQFTLTGTLPENYDDYETYFYAFHDKLSTGLEYVPNSAKVYISGASDTDITTNFTISTTVDGKGNNLNITIDNLKSVTGVSAASNIKVVYSAKLTEGAVIGSAGNPNDMYIEYSNNPNHDGEGKTGNTEKDTAVVFTYELDVNKVDGTSSAKLKDAEFVLFNEEKNAVAKVENGVLTGWDSVAEGQQLPDAATLTSDEDGKFIIKGLDSGTYYLKETKAPAGYNLLTEDVKLVITATISPEAGTVGEASLDALKIKIDTQAEKDGDKENGIVSADIANNKGTVLPETGGMGTTIFYAIGAVLVLGAGVLLVAKKRMDRTA